MARPIKKGLSYFPFDVDFFTDLKIRCLRGKYGIDGVMLYIFLLCAIYSAGYYITYDDDLIYIVSDELKISENRTRLIFDHLINRSLLNCISVDSVKVLTSASIQRRYQEAKKSSRKDIEVIEEFWVLKKNETWSFIKVRPFKNYTCKNPDYTCKNPDYTCKNDTKKSKEKKSKEERDTADKLPAPLAQSDAVTAVFAAYKRICVSYPPIARISSSRVNAVKAMLDKGYSQSVFEELLEMAEKSSFLKGANPRGWKANFDWLVKENNAVKVLDGNYNDNEEKQEHSFDIDDYKKLVNSFGKE